MAVEEFKSSRSRKRRRVSEKRKLILNERVEVRSMEEGFWGSWHPGTVIHCGKQKRHVKYDNVLDDIGSNYLVDMVVVPAILDGASSTICNERGLIRPLPPLKEFGKSDLRYGLCVDVNYQEAWWEGVIFDYSDGMEERRIFFPDLGDEITIGIGQLRITHDWSEVTGDWERRGMWVFLELVEEYKQDNLVTVSEKQIWYDLRAKEDFNKIRDWTCNVKDLWKDLVRKVLDDYFTLTLEELCIVLEPSKDLSTEAPELQSGEPTADIQLRPESNTGNFHSVLNSDNQLNSKSNVLYDAGPSNVSGHDISLAENHTEKSDLSNFLDTDQNNGSIILLQENYDTETLGDGVSNTHIVADLNTSFAEKEVLVQEESISPVRKIFPDIPEVISWCDAGAAGEVDYGAGCYKKNKRQGFSAFSRSTNWQPLILSEVELYPDSVNQYALASKTIREQLKTKVRKHIAYLGWRIDWTEHKNGHYKQRQFRYTSPEKQGKQVVYMSLREVCEHLRKDNNTVSLLSQDDQKRIYPATTIDNNVSHPTILPPPSVQDIGEPEFCPEAVLRYYLFALEKGHQDVKKYMILKARKHLLAEGWNFEYPTKRRRGMIYKSPQNQHFGSLRVACRACIKECLPRWISSEMIPLDVSSINEENMSQVESDELLCCVYQLLQKDPEWCYVNGVSPSRSTGHCKLKPSRNLKSEDDQRRMHSTTDSNILLPAILPPLSVEDVVEPEFCPEAVLRYYLFAVEKGLKGPKDVKKCMILKARKHLLAEGWTFDYPTDRRRGMIYNSPQNQHFGSLRIACRAYIEEYLPKWINSGMINPDGLGINEENISQVDSDTLLCCVSQLLQKEPELYYVNSVPPSRSTGHCKRKPSRNLNSRPPKFQRKGLPIQLKRSRKRVQRVCAPCPSHQKPQNVLSWLIDCNVVIPRSKVHYRASGISHPKAEGRVTRDGIKCNCCHRLYSLGGFENHAIRRRNCGSAAANIIIENGMSILDCQMQIMNERRARETAVISLKSVYQEENDCICSVCHYGGELILCDKCPSSFHKSCLRLEDIPEGDWFCPSCCCGICRQSKVEGADCENFLTCSQCERKYHAKCLGKRSLAKSGRYMKNCFCGKSCEKIYAGLQKLIGEPVAVGVNNLSWTLLKCVDSESCGFGNARNDLAVECYSKLNVALSVMHECFEPLQERSSGRDLVEDVLFSRWSKLNRLNFQGFYTVLLERNEEVISVATVRVYGEKVAEVPLVGTRFQYRRLGMCRILMDELEKRLKQLGVERLVLPAVPSVLDTWTNSFGFAKMTNSERSQFLDYTFLDFQDTIMCQKLLTKTPLDLVLSNESQTKAHDVLSVSGSSGCDQSSSVSEVYQAEENDKSGTLDLQMVEAFAGNNDVSNVAVNPVAMAEPANCEGRQLENGSIPECSLEDGHVKPVSTNNVAWKYYVRRKSNMKR